MDQPSPAAEAVASPAELGGDVEVLVLPWTRWPEVEPQWRRLWEGTSRRSLFMSVEWVTTWLDVFGPTLLPEFVLLTGADGVIGCCALVRKREYLSGLPIDRIYLNAGEGPDDDLCAEYTEFLCEPRHAAQAVRALHDYLARERWDELVINGAALNDSLRLLRASWDGARERVTSKRACFVDLDAIRSAGGAYLDRVSANTREQIRRSKRWYERNWGPIDIRISDTVGDARAALDHLAVLHQDRWMSKGQPGAFASVPFRAFHEQLITRLVPAGRVHLVTISAGSRPVGVLYTFVSDRRVAFYQSGFAYGTENLQKPGLISHWCALEHYLAAGYAEYDFLGRDTRYKRSLAPDSRERHWIILERASLKMRAYGWLRGLKSLLARRAHGSDAPGDDRGR